MSYPLIQPSKQLNPEVEDIFSSALNLISPDHVSVLHGDPGSSVTYESKRYGTLKLRMVEPETEATRKLFGQYLWNAGVLLAEFRSGADMDNTDTATKRARWVVKDEKVLELGAGSGFAGIVSVLAGAEEVVISDYPARELLINLAVNIIENVPARILNRVTVRGHKWGATTDNLCRSHAYRFTRIVSADCLWMSEQHHELVQSMLRFFSFDSDARVYIVAGFHTGRAVVASFFKVAEEAGLETKEIWERDVDKNDREWIEQGDTATEDITARDKWLIVVTLRRRRVLPPTFL